MSSKKEQFKNVIMDFKQKADLPELAFDSDFNCELSYMDSQAVTMHLDPDQESLVVFAASVDISEMPNRENILYRMMEANFFWLATEGFTLMLPPDSFQLVVMGRFDVAQITSAEQLSDLLYACAELARDWFDLAEMASDDCELLPDDSEDEADVESEGIDLAADLESHPWKYIRV